MKKKLLIIAVTCLAIAACKKDRTCTCTNTTLSQTSTQPNYAVALPLPTTTTTKFTHVKKNNSEVEKCIVEEVTTTGNQTFLSGSSTVNYVVTTVVKHDCALK